MKGVKKQKQWQLVFETYATAHNPDIFPGRQVIIDRLSSREATTTIHALSRAATHALLHRGSVLILCDGPVDTMTRASTLAEERPEHPASDLLEAVCHYVEAESGENCLLATCLRHGVAYHHAGVSLEARWLVECLIREGIVTLVCGTTTLAQGANFPITTVIVETLTKGWGGKLSFQDFWNIAGRAGRTLVDTLGVVAFPAPTSKKQKAFEEFLTKEAEEIVSQLVTLIQNMSDFTNVSSLSYLRDNRALSPLLQFLAHAMRVSGNENVADDVEDLLRSSLVYHQIRKQNRVVAARLIRICRRYLERLV